MPLVSLPVGRDYTIALGASSGGIGSIARGRGRPKSDSVDARRLHPSTVACWAGGASEGEHANDTGSGRWGKRLVFAVQQQHAGR
jgi:hypothetical protein